MEMRYVMRFPYLDENGCQNSRLHPRNRYMFPEPWLRVAMETPDASERGTRTEYTVDTAIPANQV